MGTNPSNLSSLTTSCQKQAGRDDKQIVGSVARRQPAPIILKYEHGGFERLS